VAPLRALTDPRRLAGIGVVVSALAVAVTLEASGAPPPLGRSMGFVILAIGFWAFGVIVEALTGLILLLGVVTLAGIAPSVAFSGYTTTAYWLVFAGAVISASANRTGLSRWLGGLLTDRMGPHTGYGLRVAGVVGFASLLALVLPSTMARVAILLPLVLAISEASGFVPGSKGRTGLVLAAAIGTYVVPITFLPANVPNMVLAGSMEAIHGVTLSFGGYMLLHFPVIGLTKGVALVAIITWMFRDTPNPPAFSELTDAGAPAAGLSPVGLRLLIVMGVTLLLWATDVVHGISPAWVGLGAAIVCLLPASAILRMPDLPAQTVFPMLVYIGAVLGIGAIMIESGAGAWLSGLMLARLPLAEASDFARLTLLAGMATLTGLATTMPAAPAISAPLFGQMAQMTGWSVEAVGMSQVLGYATPLLPYQVPPLMVAIAMSGVPAVAAIRVLVVLALVTTPIILAAAHMWWSFLGWY
jgi:di/tricarboxylate transporter